MKKILLALTAVAAMTGSASAADLGARPYVKAPMAAPVANWTGFYIFGGGGGGLSAADQHVQTTVGASADDRSASGRLAGSAPSVSATTGSLAAPGSPACSQTVSSAASALPFRIRPSASLVARSWKNSGLPVSASAIWSHRTFSPMSTAVIPALTSARLTSSPWLAFRRCPPRQL